MRLHALLLNVALGAALIISSSCAYNDLASRPKPVNWKTRPVTYGKPQLWNKKQLTWQLDPTTTVPAHLDPVKLDKAIADSFKAWEPAGIFSFAKAAEGQKADIVICFGSPAGKIFERKDKAGCMGQAGYPWTASRGRIYLDPSEMWSTEPFAIFRDPLVKWLPHEIGHVLGLQHSYTERDQTMCAHGPYQAPDEESFSRLRRLYAPKTSVFLPGQIFAMHDVAPQPEPYTPLMLRSAVAMEAE